MNEAEYYRLQTSSLFSEWRTRTHHNNLVFNADGIVDPETWFALDEQHKPKILLVLKEAYHTSEHQTNNYDLADDLKHHGPWGNVWVRVAEWAYGLLSTSTEGLPAYKKLSWEEANRSLKQIAVLNLKKSGGKSSSVMDDIKYYVEQDADMIQRQIELISPSIIVCGYTFEALNMAMGTPFDKTNTRCENWHYRDKKGRIFLDYYHPANHYPALINYYGLVGIYQQALIDKPSEYTICC